MYVTGFFVGVITTGDFIHKLMKGVGVEEKTLQK